MDKYPFTLRYLIRLAFIFAVIITLIFTRQLLVPLFLAVLLAYILYPTANRLENNGVPRIATNLILIVGLVAIVLGIAYALALLAITFSDDLPAIKERMETNITNFRWAMGRTFGVTAEQLDSVVANLQESGQYLSQFFTDTANTLLTIGLIPVYTFLLLFYRDKFRKFISMMVNPDYEGATQNIIDRAAEIVPRYLKGLFIVCFILSGLNSLGFYLIGLKYALFLGVIAAVFNLIPYLGTIIGYGIVFLFVLATQSPSLALAVVIQFFIVQFLENNILTPNITGSYVEMNPLVIILALFSGGMIWGLPGMFLIIPYLAMFKIVCENIPELKPVGYLLGTEGTERHSISIKSVQKIFGWESKE